MKLKQEFVKLDSDERLHGLETPVVGLTGGIASGKSTVSALFEKAGLKIISADHLIKQLYTTQEVIETVEKYYPEVMNEGSIEFPKLRKLAFDNPKVREALEMLLYSKMPNAFISELSKLGSPDVIVYDVPLLFEKGLFRRVDYSICVYAPKDSQVERLVKRDSHDKELALKIISAQMDIEEKKNKADFIIDNTGSLEELSSNVEKAITHVFES